MSMPKSADARRLVVEYEAGHLTETDLLKGCDWSLAPVTDPVAFADQLYGSLRPLEATAYKNRGASNPLVVQHAQAANAAVEHIAAMRERVAAMTTVTDLERAGQAFLLDRLDWALGVIANALPKWGY